MSFISAGKETGGKGGAPGPLVVAFVFVAGSAVAVISIGVAKVDGSPGADSVDLHGLLPCI